MSSLPTRRLGKDGPVITAVGFGAWAAGGGGWAFAYSIIRRQFVTPLWM